MTSRIPYGSKAWLALTGRPVSAKAADPKRHRAGVPNALESRFARDVLEPSKRTGHTLRYDFEPLKLLLARQRESLTDTGELSTEPANYYIPDWLERRASGLIIVHECKGAKKDGKAWCEDDAKDRWRMSVASWFDYYAFQWNVWDARRQLWRSNFYAGGTALLLPLDESTDRLDFDPLGRKTEA